MLPDNSAPTPQTIQVMPAPSFELASGLHTATVVSASLRWHNNRNGRLYTALHLEFGTPDGGKASLMSADFLGFFPTIFAALGQTLEVNQEVPVEQLLGLRNTEAEIHVVQRPYNGKTYSNVTNINGVMVTK
jgi:hypothetical protein